MNWKVLSLFSIAILIDFCLPARTAAQETLRHSKSHKIIQSQPVSVAQIQAPQQTPTAAPAVSAPASQTSLEQQPASAPQVAFRGGELTIVARNASLGAILQDVQTQTGASIDMPGTPNERVVGQFGPGPAREVLASLLNGSHFNYVLLGSQQNPDALEKIVLMSKPADELSSEASPSATSAVQTIPFRPGPAVIRTDDNSEDSADNSEQMTQPEQNGDDQADQNNGQNPPAAIKTPQELLQELQRQQQSQQQGQAPPGQDQRQPK